MEVIVDQPGTFLGKHSERLRVLKGKEVLSEYALFDVEHVVVLGGGVSVSSDLIQECASRGIPLSFISRQGDPIAQVMPSILSRVVQTRREQLLAYNDHRGKFLALAFADGKLANQTNLLKYMLKNRAADDPELAAVVREAGLQIDQLRHKIRAVAGANVDDARQMILTWEAHAAQHYWDAARHLIIPEVGWDHRMTRGATDLVNSALNYGYAILYAEVGRAILYSGLDPYAGFLHVDRAGKPSLALDLIEEFRQLVVDRTIFGLLNRRVALVAEDGMLDDASRKLIATHVIERLDAEEPYQKKKLRLRSIIQSQARRVASYLRDEAPYAPWIGRW